MPGTLRPARNGLVSGVPTLEAGLDAIAPLTLSLALRLHGAAAPSACRDCGRMYSAAMLDIKLIRDRADFVRQRLALRGGEEAAQVDKLLQLDEQRRKALAEVEALKAQRNRVSKEIGALMAQKQVAEAQAKKQEAGGLGDRIAALDKEAVEAEAARDEAMLGLPNLPHESVPAGKSAADNPVVRLHGEKPAFGFQPKSHVELCEGLGLVDFERAAKLSGSGFVLYTNWGARLERALIQFMLDLHSSVHGYTEVSPPFVVGPQCLEGVGQFPKFKDQYYGVAEGDDKEKLGKLYLIPTAETPVANIHREELLKESDLPKHYVAYTPCFRGEAGAAGVGTRGIIRVHQFDKVELIRIVKPEDSGAAHEQMLRDAEAVLQALGLHYRVVLLCTGDMGFASAKTYDIEVWAPGQGSYLEVSSVSNCEDFQSRRMKLRYKSANGENRFPHLLNGSGTALARLFVALIETCQQADGSLVLPAKLQPYLKAERIQA
jgi:seryl-tRNA synthetase